MIIGAAGLASNLAALRALATDGIQRGHMTLHRKMAEKATAAAEKAAEKAATRLEEAGRGDAQRDVERVIAERQKQKAEGVLKIDPR